MFLDLGSCIESCVSDSENSFGIWRSQGEQKLEYSLHNLNVEEKSFETDQIEYFIDVLIFRTHGDMNTV